MFRFWRSLKWSQRSDAAIICRTDWPGLNGRAWLTEWGANTTDLQPIRWSLVTLEVPGLRRAPNKNYATEKGILIFLGQNFYARWGQGHPPKLLDKRSVRTMMINFQSQPHVITDTHTHTKRIVLYISQSWHLVYTFWTYLKAVPILYDA